MNVREMNVGRPALDKIDRVPLQGGDGSDMPDRADSAVGKVVPNVPRLVWRNAPTAPLAYSDSMAPRASLLP